MLTAIEGVYKNGAVHLKEQPSGIDRANVVVTFLESTSMDSPSIKMQFGQYPADQAFNDADFAAAEWRDGSEQQ